MDNLSPLAEDQLPDDLHQLAQRYAAQPTPRPTPESTTRLIALLFAEDPALRAQPAPREARLVGVWPVLSWRLRFLGPWFWVASVCLFALAALLTPHLGSPDGLSPLVLLAPLTMILSLTHALRTPSGGLRAVEQSCPIGFITSSAALVLALVVFDGLLGLLATVGLALLQWAPFGALALAWLCPLLLLAGISLPVALRWGATPAACIGGGPWLLLAVVALFAPSSAVTQLFALPQTSLSLALHVAAAGVGLGILLLVLLGRTQSLSVLMGR